MRDLSLSFKLKVKLVLTSFFFCSIWTMFLSIRLWILQRSWKYTATPETADPEIPASMTNFLLRVSTYKQTCYELHVEFLMRTLFDRRPDRFLDKHSWFPPHTHTINPTLCFAIYPISGWRSAAILSRRLKVFWVTTRIFLHALIIRNTHTVQ